MNYEESKIVKWTSDMMLEVALQNPDNFLKIRETLTRIGIPNIKDKVLYQSCHILHKKGKYYIVHFKELFAIDNKITTLTESDILRRNIIAKLLEHWNLCTIVNCNIIVESNNNVQMKILRHSEKSLWKLVTKYEIGSSKNFNKK